MRKEYTFKLNDYVCDKCNNRYLYLDKIDVAFKQYYVCKCANCGYIVAIPSRPLVTVIKEHLREVRRNESNI